MIEFHDTGKSTGFTNNLSNEILYKLPAAVQPANVIAPKSLKHKRGTTTLAICLKDCVVVCVDSRASMGTYISSNAVFKLIPCFPLISFNEGGKSNGSTVIGTMAGGAADCSFWERHVSCLTNLANFKKETFNATTVSKLLCDALRQYRGMGLSVGSLIAGADEFEGGKLYLVGDDGGRVEGTVLSVGSGSTYAYGIVDSILNKKGEEMGIDVNNDNDYKEVLSKLSIEDVVSIAKKALYFATHRDGASGGMIRTVVVSKEGWEYVFQGDMNTLTEEMTKK
eukprot:GAHX01000008.1.p1 GENE.GAHX01000008.1~~GAHX01000008.1.p1  ORF type:complete len:281 (+),score=52.19 GAHX01000008.1:52-894(+)